MYELVLDILPDDPRHLVAIQLHHRVLDLDLLEAGHIARLYEGTTKSCGCEGRGWSVLSWSREIAQAARESGS